VREQSTSDRPVCPLAVEFEVADDGLSAPASKASLRSEGGVVSAPFKESL
jgi:hypothetical protein